MKLTGTYTIEDLVIKDPEVTVESVNYIIPRKSVAITIRMVNSYDFVRSFETPYDDFLTTEEINQLVLDALEKRLNTPPESNGFYIVIPVQFQWAFPIKIAGFECPVIDRDGKKVVEASYLTWQSFLDEFDKPGYTDLKSALYPIFEYAKTNPEIIQ